MSHIRQCVKGAWYLCEYSLSPLVERNTPVYASIAVIKMLFFCRTIMVNMVMVLALGLPHIPETAIGYCEDILWEYVRAFSSKKICSNKSFFMAVESNLMCLTGLPQC